MIPLYEAIALSTHGCALGRAVDAVGQTRHHYPGKANNSGDYTHAPDIWDWLGVYQPTTCPVCKIRPEFTMPLLVIIHVWDAHMAFHDHMTLDGFLDWIKSIDPTLKTEKIEAEPSAAEAKNVETAELITA